jgi:hypothetical protein
MSDGKAVPACASCIRGPRSLMGSSVMGFRDRQEPDTPPLGHTATGVPGVACLARRPIYDISR